MSFWMWQMSDALDKKLDTVFRSVYEFNNKKIEDALRRNFTHIDVNELKKIHLKVLDLLDIASQEESKYFTFEKFKRLYLLVKFSTETELFDINDIDLL